MRPPTQWLGQVAPGGQAAQACHPSNSLSCIAISWHQDLVLQAITIGLALE
jgi:hypothetical protein